MQANYSEIAELSERYARALFELALEKNALPQVEKELSALVKATQSSSELQTIIESPVVSRKEVQDVFAELTKKLGLSEITAGVVRLLIKNRRIAYVSYIRDSFQRKLLKHKGVVEAEVHSAIKLPPESLKKIEEILKSSLKAEIRLSPKVMPEIMGGLRVKVGSQLFDDSLAAKLDKLELSLKESLQRNLI